MSEIIFKQRDWSSHPPQIAPDYKSSVLRAPTKPLVKMPDSALVASGPVFGHDMLGEHDGDLTINGRVNGEPIGERIVVIGRVLDENGRGVPGALVEIWQCNAAGRYVHRAEIHDAPLDPNFLGAGRAITAEDGAYRFVTIKPGSYPWGNHPNAWRPAHIHFSIFGTNFADRLVTQMYFEGDPTFPFDPIFNAVGDADARERMVARFSMTDTVPDWAHCYRFDIILRGRDASIFEDDH